MSKLLLDDKPLIILPSLANKVGLNEAIILQQLHYWLGISTNKKDGEVWVYNTYDDWREQFPFWSVSTIRRTITKLENSGLIIVGKFNKLKIDNTKWYRIDYLQLESVNRPSVQNEQTNSSKRTDELFNMNKPLPESTSENTSREKDVVDEGPGMAFRYYEENVGPLVPSISETINIMIDESSEELVKEALHRAVLANAGHKIKFADRILKNWSDKRIKTLADVIAADKEFERRKRGNPNGTTPKHHAGSADEDWDDLSL